MKPNQKNRLFGNSLRPGDSIEAFLALVRKGQQEFDESELRLKADPSIWDHLSPDEKAKVLAMRSLLKDLPQTQN